MAATAPALCPPPTGRAAAAGGRQAALWNWARRRRLRALQARKVEQHVRHQLAGLARYLRRAGPGVLPPDLRLLAASSAARLRATQGACDSDATGSSSGSGEEEGAGASLGRRHAEHQWAMQRAAIICRWMWLRAQISDLEYRIRQQTDIYKRLRAAESSPPTEPLGHATWQSPSCTRISGSPAPLRACATSPRPLLKPLTVKCRCEWPSSRILCSCKAAVQTVNPDTMSLAERTALLDSGFHPTLSLSHGNPLHLHFETFLREDGLRGLLRHELKALKMSCFGKKDPTKSAFPKLRSSLLLVSCSLLEGRRPLEGTPSHSFPVPSPRAHKHRSLHGPEPPPGPAASQAGSSAMPSKRSGMFLHHQQRCDPNVKGSRHPSGEAPVQRDCSAKVLQQSRRPMGWAASASVSSRWI